MERISKSEMTLERVALQLADEFLPEVTRFTVKEYHEAVDQLDPTPLTTLETLEINGYLICSNKKPLVYEITESFERWMTVFKTHR